MGFVASSDDAQPKQAIAVRAPVRAATVTATAAMGAPCARRGKRGHMWKLWYVSGTLASTAGQLMRHLRHCRTLGRRIGRIICLLANRRRRFEALTHAVAL